MLKSLGFHFTMSIIENIKCLEHYSYKYGESWANLESLINAKVPQRSIQFKYAKKEWRYNFRQLKKYRKLVYGQN